jgi:hypothetical protein
MAVLTLLVGSLTGQAVAQERASKPVKVKKDIFEVQCRFGAADSSQAPIAMRYGMDPADAAVRIRTALKDADLKLAKDGVLYWTTAPVAQWPSGPRGDRWRAFAHPGVYAAIILGQKADTVVVLGGVEALCASSPGAPDSTVAAAVSLFAEDVSAILLRSSPMPDVSD